MVKKKTKKQSNKNLVKKHISEQKAIMRHQERLKKKLERLNKQVTEITQQINPNTLSAVSFNHERVRYFQFNPNMIYPLDYLKMLIREKYSSSDPSVCYHTQLLIKLPKGIKGLGFKGTAKKVKEKKKNKR